MSKDKMQFLPTREEIESVCAACYDKPVTVRDVLGYPYCEAHEYRAELMAWGKANGFPDLNCMPLAFFAIGPGEYCWRRAVPSGKDDGLAVAHEMILRQQAEQQKGA